MMTIFKTTGRSECEWQKLIYNDEGSITDIADICGLTPFDELLNKEERDLIKGSEEREAQIVAISALLAYLFKDQEPVQVLIRLFLLAYTVNPSLVDGMTLEQIGKSLGGISKQRMSTNLAKQDRVLGYRGRNRKTEEQKKASSAAQKVAWVKRKANTTRPTPAPAEPSRPKPTTPKASKPPTPKASKPKRRKQTRKQMLAAKKRYREANRELLRAKNQRYRDENKDEIKRRRQLAKQKRKEKH